MAGSGRGRWTWAGALVAMALAGGIVVGVLRYRPLVHGDYFACGLRETGVRGRACLVEYRDGRSTIWGFTLRNDGPVAVTVTEATPDGDGLLPVEDVLMWPEEGLGVFVLRREPLVPFAPFTLEPGEERLVAFRGRFDGCEGYAPGTASRYPDVHVGFRVFGIPREAEVALWSYVEVPAPPDCPR